MPLSQVNLPHRLDSYLLTVFSTIYQERNITKAARVLKISQPALSQSLNRLRLIFEDPLFIKSTHEMIPTQKAESLREPIRKILTELSTLLSSQEFCLKQLRRTFRIQTTDLIESLLLPHFLDLSATSAPGTRWSFVTTGFKFPKRTLETGEGDIAIAGFFKHLPKGFYRQELCQDPFVCVTRAGHPLLRKKTPFDLTAYLKLEHLLVAPEGHLVGNVDNVLHAMNKKRKIRAGLCSFMSAGWTLERTDAVLTIPSLMANRIKSHFKIVIWPAPLPLPAIRIVQAWHERSHHDLAHQWLRQTIYDFFKLRMLSMRLGGQDFFEIRSQDKHPRAHPH